MKQILSAAAFRNILSGICLGLLAFAGGCVNYGYDLVQPPPARPIPADGEIVLHMDPLDFHLHASHNRLLMKIDNPTDDVIRLVPDRSVVVDPSGQSHPLPPRTVAPHSYATLLLPPLPPVAYAYGPAPYWGWGVGYWHGRYGGAFWYNDPYFYGPVAYTYVPNDPSYWQWLGETDVRLNLTFLRNGAEFNYEFTFHQRQLK